MKKELKDIVRALNSSCSEVEECLSLIQTAFLYNSPKLLKEVRAKAENIQTSEQLLTTQLAELVKSDPEAKAYVSVPGHLRQIAENILRLVEHVEKKVQGGILFSDRAFEESTFLFQRLMDILRPTADIILARNIIIAKYIRESESEVASKALQYATHHEERLIGGVCTPIASSIFIGMLDAIKGIAWHAQEIASKLTA